MSVSDMYNLTVSGALEKQFDHRVSGHLRKIILGEEMPCEFHPGSKNEKLGLEIKPHMYDREADLLAKLDKVDALQDEAARLIEEVALAIP